MDFSLVRFLVFMAFALGPRRITGAALHLYAVYYLATAKGILYAVAGFLLPGVAEVYAFFVSHADGGAFHKIALSAVEALVAGLVVPYLIAFLFGKREQ